MHPMNERDLPTPVLLPRRPAGERLRAALDAIVHALTQALASPAATIESVRAVAVRYGRLAREQALQLDETIAGLTRVVAAAVDPLPTAQRDELLASVQWWAVHGYHRAD